MPAYSSIVYKKGAVVIDMLARFWGEETFIEILGRITRAADGHVISTEDFFDLLEKATGADLDAFAERFVYGTGLPDIYYDYRFEALDDGRYRIHLEAEQEVPYRFRYEIVERPTSLDVTRQRIDQTDEQTAPMVVPFQVEIEKPGIKDDEVHVLNGRVVLSEPKTILQMDIEDKPIALRLDAQSQVFGDFHNRKNRPKNIDYWRAVAFAANAGADEDTVQEAKRLFEAVLDIETPVPNDAGRGERKDAEEHDRFHDWRAHLQMARLDLQVGALDGAAAALDRAEKLRPRGSMIAKNRQRKLQARLALLRGQSEEAYDELRRIIRKQKKRADVETWLLMAIAAHQTGRDEEAKETLEKLDEVDVGTELLTSRFH